MNVRTIGVVGAGQMGRGIAHQAALSGYEVIVTDLEADVLSRCLSTVAKNLDRQINKGTVKAELRETVLERITSSTHLSAHKSADVVIETAVESFGIKSEIFRQLDEICGEKTIFASNTSAIAITRMAACTGRPQQFIGMHFMNPVPMMQLVEVIRGLETSDETFETIIKLAESMDKTPVACKDFPGFVSNRVLMPMINEAIFSVYEGVASVSAVDEIFKLGMNHPMGPLELADLIGLDNCLAVLRMLYDGFGDPKYRPCPLLVKMVEAGRLGRKTNRGFYTYDGA